MALQRLAKPRPARGLWVRVPPPPLFKEYKIKNGK